MKAAAIRTKLEKLNGWQRLWLIAAILWLVGSVAIVASDFPTEDRFRERAQNGFMSLYQPMLENANSQRTHCMGLLEKKEYAALNPCMKLAGEARQVYQENLDGAMRRYEDRISAEVLNAQLLAAGKFLALWLVPSVAVYLLGLGIAWALKGFRSTEV